MNFPSVDSILRYQQILLHLKWHLPALLVAIALGILTLTASLWFWGGILLLTATQCWLYRRYLHIAVDVNSDLDDFYEEIEDTYLEGLSYHHLRDQRFDYKASLGRSHAEVMAFREVLKTQDAYVVALHEFFRPYEALPLFRVQVFIPQPYVVDGVFDQNRFQWQIFPFQLWESDYAEIWGKLSPEDRRFWQIDAENNLQCPYLSIVLSLDSWYAFVRTQPTETPTRTP